MRVVDLFVGSVVEHRGRSWVVMQSQPTDDHTEHHRRARRLLLRPVEWTTRHVEGLTWEWVPMIDLAPRLDGRGSLTPPAGPPGSTGPSLKATPW